MSYYYWLLFIGILLIVAALASKYADKFGLSSLVITLFIGLLAGNGYDYDVQYNFPLPTLRISEIALSVIIFSGGFESNWKTIKPVALKGGLLATIGVVITAVTIGLFACFMFDWPIYVALLLGAVLSSTDAAAVFSILEHTGLKLQRGIGRILEFESGTNDPVAFFLTFLFIELALGNSMSLGGGILFFLQNMSLGLLTGWGVGKIVLIVGPKINLKRGQAPIVLLVIIIILFSVNMIIGGSAFLAMYIFGIILGNNPWLHRDVNKNFYESLSWLMEASLFLLLGLQIFIENVYKNIEWGLFVGIFLIFIARPIATMISLAPFYKMRMKDKAFISWVGLRGATPIVFGLMAVVQGVPHAESIFSIAFVVVILSLLLQGHTIALVKRWLSIKE